MTNANTLTHRVHVLRDELADRRRRRREEGQLRRELSSFTSPSQIDDLLAAIRDDDSRDAERMRAILLANRAAQPWWRSVS